MAEGLSYGKQKLINSIILQLWNEKNPEKRKYNYHEMLYIIQELFTEEGKAYAESQSVNRGTTIFKHFVLHLLYRNIANYDSMVLLTSDKGTGKSSAAIMMAREWCHLLGIQFDPARHIAYNNNDVLNKIENLRPFEPIIADEAIRFASSADWAKKENKQLKKKLAQVRTKHLLYILCFPLKIEKVEKTYLESFTNYWIDLYDRGVGAIYVKDKNPSLDSWRIKDFKNVGSYTEFTTPAKIKERLKKHPNFWQIIKFPKPPEWLYSRYLKVREKNVYDEDNVMATVTKEDINNALLILALRDIMMNDVNLTMNRVILHIKNEYDITLSKGMVEAALSDAKQLVTKIREGISNE